jgi:hypothetical protein
MPLPTPPLALVLALAQRGRVSSRFRNTLNIQQWQSPLLFLTSFPLHFFFSALPVRYTAQLRYGPQGAHSAAVVDAVQDHLQLKDPPERPQQRERDSTHVRVADQ